MTTPDIETMDVLVTATPTVAAFENDEDMAFRSRMSFFHRLRAYLPVYTLSPGPVIGPLERLSWPSTIVLGLQHVLAMFGGTVLMPLLMGADPNTSLFFSGVGT